MINHTYLRNKIADLQEQINRQRIINHRLMSLMEAASQFTSQYVDEFGNPVTVDEKSLESDRDGNLMFNGVKVKKIEPQESKTPPTPQTQKPSDTKEPEKPSTPEVPQPNVDPSGLANQAGPGAAAMANQLAQAGVGAAGQPSQSGGVNLNFANMFAGQFAKGPVNVGGNQQVSSGSGAQTMNFGTMASGNAVVAGGGISNSNIVSGNSNSNTAINSKVASGKGSVDSGNTTNTNSNVASGGSSIGVNTKPAATSASAPAPAKTETKKPFSTDVYTPEQKKQAAQSHANAMGMMGMDPNTGKIVGQSSSAAKTARGEMSQKPKQTVKEDFQLKVNQTLNEMTRLFGRKDGGLRKS